MIRHVDNLYAFLHLPKTGGTFFREILTNFFNGVYNNDKYRFHAVPENYGMYTHRIGLVRDPFEFYVSLFYSFKKFNADHPAPLFYYLIPVEYKDNKNSKIFNDLKHITSYYDQDDKTAFKNFYTYLNNLDHGYIFNDHWWGNYIDFSSHGDLNIGLYSRVYMFMYYLNSISFFESGYNVLSALIRTDNIFEDTLFTFKTIGLNTESFSKNFGNFLNGDGFKKPDKNINTKRKYDYIEYYDDQMIQACKDQERYILRDIEITKVKNKLEY